MIAIILAGGYAQRLWPLTLEKPKVLLPIAGKPVIDYVMEKVLKINPPVKKIIISTNLKFQSQFENWLANKNYTNVELVPDNSRSQYEKIGAIKALSNIIIGMNDDIFVVAGDNIILDELSDLIKFFYQIHSSVIGVYRAKNYEDVKKGASVLLDDKNRIIEFIEKPENSKTNLVGACIYVFPSLIGIRLEEYLKNKLSQDEPGRFIEWLHKMEPVYGYMLNGNLLDIGTFQSYKEAENYLRKLT